MAAGIAGFIKAVMALEHRELPPTLHFEKPNPDIDFERSPFFVNTALRPWNDGAAPRRAGVSAFGIGGTNAHVILEEAPPVPPRALSEAPQVLIVSARTPSALSAAASGLATHLQRTPQIDLRDVAYTLQTGRRAFEHRAVAVCRTSSDAILAFGGLSERVFSAESIQSASSVLVFPPTDEHAPVLVQALMRTEPWFRESVAACREAFSQLVGHDAVGVDVDASVFALQLGLARRIEQMGLRPSALAGHGVGLIAAAHIGDLVSLDDAVQLVLSRGVRHLPARVPRTPVYDHRTGRRVDARDLLERSDAPHTHSEELNVLVREDMCVLIQVGPGRDAAFQLRTGSRSPESPVISMLEGAEDGDAGTKVLEGLGRIWTVGCDLDWAPLHAGARFLRVPLPTYPFERQRFWVEPRPVVAPPMKRVGKIEDLREWFHRPAWAQAAPLPAPNPTGSALDRTWLLFMDEQGMGANLAVRLRARGYRVVEAHRASAFARVDGDTFRINAASDGDYQQLIGACASMSPAWSIVHLWASGESPAPDNTTPWMMSGGWLLQRPLTCAGARTRRLERRVASADRHERRLAVTGEEALRPSRSALIGACRVIPQELPHVSCALIDVALNSGRAASRQIELLLDELVAAPADHIVAHRGATRWIQTFDPIRIEPVERPSDCAIAVSISLRAVPAAWADDCRISRCPGSRSARAGEQDGGTLRACARPSRRRRARRERRCDEPRRYGARRRSRRCPIRPDRWRRACRGRRGRWPHSVEDEGGGRESPAAEGPRHLRSRRCAAGPRARFSCALFVVAGARGRRRTDRLLRRQRGARRVRARAVGRRQSIGRLDRLGCLAAGRHGGEHARAGGHATRT